MTEWHRFAFAGRMQKPVLNIFEDKEVVDAMGSNLDMALSLAILMHYHEVDPIKLEHIFGTLCNFSYNGDIRMRYKMENPDKVKNIVKGSLNELHDLYESRLQDMEIQGILNILPDK